MYKCGLLAYRSILPESAVVLQLYNSQWNARQDYPPRTCWKNIMHLNKALFYFITRGVLAYCSILLGSAMVLQLSKSHCGLLHILRTWKHKNMYLTFKIVPCQCSPPCYYMISEVLACRSMLHESHSGPTLVTFLALLQLVIVPLCILLADC